MIKLVWHDLPAIYPCWLTPITVNLFFLKKQLQTNCKWRFHKNNVHFECLPPVVTSVVMERTDFCVILGMGQTKREPEGTGTSTGTKELSLQRGLLQSRTLESFHRETQHKELSLAWDTQNRISSDLISYGLWQSTLVKRECGAGATVRSALVASNHRQHHHLLHLIKLLKKAIAWLNYPHYRKTSWHVT